MRKSATLAGATIAVVSRCAWTLFNFRTALMRALMTEGARVLAFGASGDGFERRLREASIEFRPIPVGRSGLSPLADLRLILCLIAEFRRHRPLLVHCFTVKPAIYGTLAAWIAGVPVRIVTITGLGHAFTTAAPWIARLVSLLYKLALRRAHFVYFQNAEDRDLFATRGLVAHQSSGLVAGSGIDTDVFRPAPLPVCAPSSAPRFLMISRLIREKGVLEFLRAAEMVKERFPHVKFQLLGGVDARNPSGLTVAEFRDIRTSSTIEWLGETDDVRPFLAAADVVVLPSYREGLPRVLVEAASMGRPAIAADVTGSRDVVVDGLTGYLVPLKDPIALAEAMCRFIARPEDIVSMGAAARARAVSLFDERHIVESILDCYVTLLSK